MQTAGRTWKPNRYGISALILSGYVVTFGVASLVEVSNLPAIVQLCLVFFSLGASPFALRYLAGITIKHFKK